MPPPLSPLSHVGIHPTTLLQDKDGVPCRHQVLIYGGKLLEDACTLGACGLEAGSTVHQTSRLRGGKPVKVRPQYASSKFCL